VLVPKMEETESGLHPCRGAKGEGCVFEKILIAGHPTC
jgi:hypothetical protein